MSLENFFNVVLGLATAGFWYWVRNLREDMQVIRKAGQELGKDVNQVKLDYQTKADAKDNQRVIMDTLRDINNKLEKIQEKLNQKADR